MELATTTEEKDLQNALAAQHPLHAMLGEVFEELGGKEFLLTWAEENQTEFIRMMMKLAPPAPPKGATGGLHLHLHQDLKPSELDGGTIPGVTIENE